VNPEPQILHPEIFGVWMSMLQKLPGAILFFSHKSYSCHARVHLRRAAAQARVDPDRLIFLERADSRGGYLSLVSGCDLLLDTPLFNAQTTAVDFLWANVAILTLPSERWVGRVGASLARACSTPTSVIVARDTSDYRRLGIALASRAALLVRPCTPTP
jgi:protein O-GlcNAc transferase